MSQVFTTKVGEFEGPLDLLLSLIEKRKLHISEVSLSQVADDYISHISDMEQTSKHDMANFLVIASTLILIKSIALLPTLETTPEETSDVSDLQKRLRLYELFKRAAEKVAESWKASTKIFFREGRTATEPVFAPASDATIESLSGAMRSVLANLPKPEKLPEVVVKKVISLEEVIEGLTHRIQRAMKMRFSEFAKSTGEDRISVIVSFLGMLELVKQGIINVQQDTTYGDIDIENMSLDVPRYH